MLRGAASYLWGSSTQPNTTENKTNVNNIDQDLRISKLSMRENNNNYNNLTTNTNINPPNTYLHLSQFVSNEDNNNQTINKKSNWYLPSTAILKRFIPSGKPSTNPNSPKNAFMHENTNKMYTNTNANTKTIPTENTSLYIYKHTNAIEQKSPTTTPTTNTNTNTSQVSIHSKNDPRYKYRLSATDNIAFLFEDDSNHNSHQQPTTTTNNTTANNNHPTYDTNTNKNSNNFPNLYLLSTNRRLIQHSTNTSTIYDIYPYLKSPEKVPQYLVVTPHTNEKQYTMTDNQYFPIHNLSKQQRIEYFINGLQGLTNIERNGIHALFTYIKNDRLSRKLQYDILLGDVILSYFSALSPTNPDPIGCWKRWIAYRVDVQNTLFNTSINDDCKEIYEFFKTGIYNIGFDNDQCAVWFVSSENYTDEFSSEVVTKATIMWLCSLMWNLKTNEFDLFSLRKGIVGFTNLSHFSFNMMSWSTLKMVKNAMISYPFFNARNFSVNTPTLIYLAKHLAVKILAPNAMEKWIDLSDIGLYYESYGSRYKTPVDAGGTLKVTGVQWMIDRGYLDYVP